MAVRPHEALSSFEIPKRTGATGFSLQPGAGLVTPKLFMERLDDGIFLATQYTRHHSRPLYTPEADVVHEIVGHVPSIVRRTPSGVRPPR